MSNFGTTRDGHPIVARGCAEDNSGIVFQRGNEFVISMTYPIDMTDDGVEVFQITHTDEKAAVAEFKRLLGSFGYGD